MNPDLLIMAFVADIIPPAFIEAPTRGTICYHPSLLPRHRGGSAINWALIMGDKETGLSIFWTDAGIDTGPILLQKRLPIAREDTTGSLYFNRLFPFGVEAIAESVDLIKAGRAPRLVQDESLATYEPLCNDQVARIDWGRPAEEVHNLIRGCDPQPGAYTFYQGKKVRFFDARRGDAVLGARPGEVIKADAGRFIVVADGGTIRIGKVRTEAVAFCDRQAYQRIGLWTFAGLDSSPLRSIWFSSCLPRGGRAVGNPCRRAALRTQSGSRGDLPPF